MCKTDQVKFIGNSTDDGLVSEVEMKPLKIHLPVNPLITVCLRVKEMKKCPNQQNTLKALYFKYNQRV